MNEQDETRHPKETAAAADADAGRTADEEQKREAAGDGSPEDVAEPDPAALVAELEAERDEYKKKLMYALAESENIRKRAERDRREAEAYGGTRLARDLLSVHDNLARAIDAADAALREQAAAFFEGVELTQRELLNAFHKHKIEKVEPEKGEKFDPNLHQAMFEAPVPGAENGAIIEVMQAGFTIAGRLLRPALVGVAKAAPASQTDDAA
ncbi:MAG: nucleotide exchange factor GrpE [Rhodobacteraceae bacterium]|nr:MAG: nucleotide exchange factor GrpE [Paracoccaceae bacterium]